MAHSGPVNAAPPFKPEVLTQQELAQELRAQPPPYPHVLLLLLELLVVDGWRGQLRDQGLRFLDPRVQLLVGLPKLVHQDLRTLQASVAL